MIQNVQDFINQINQRIKGTVAPDAANVNAVPRGIDIMNAQNAPAENRGFWNILSNISRDRAISNISSGMAQKNEQQRQLGNTETQSKIGLTNATADRAPHQNNLDEAQAEYYRAHAGALAKGIGTTPVDRISGAYISSNTLQRRALAGEQFLDRQDHPIDIKSMQPNEGLVAISGGPSGATRYVRVDQPPLVTSMGNVTNVSPKYDPTNPLAQGVQNPPKINTDETVMQNPQGETVMQPKYSTSQTQTDPITKPPIGGNKPLNPPGLVGQDQPRTLPGGVMPPNAANQQRQFSVPVKTAAVNLFGDPTNASFKGLASFAHLADDPQSRARVGTVMRMVLQDMAAAGGAGGEFGISAANISANTGGFIGYLRNILGGSKAISAAQAQAVEQAVQSLTPEENEFVTRLFAAYGSISGMRTITRGGAYRFSMEALERELPIPGIGNVQSAAGFYQKLASLGEEVSSAIEGSGINREFLPQAEYWRQKTDEFTKMGRVPAGTPRVMPNGRRIFLSPPGVK